MQHVQNVYVILFDRGLEENCTYKGAIILQPDIKEPKQYTAAI